MKCQPHPAVSDKLFPRELARQVYATAMTAGTPGGEMAALLAAAEAHQISLFSVFRETANHAQAAGLPALKVAEADIHAVRNSQAVRGELVSATLFKPLPPAAQTYLAAAHGVFQSQFFVALRAMLRERGTGVGYVQQVLDLALPDAQAVNEELTR